MHPTERSGAAGGDESTTPATCAASLRAARAPLLSRRPGCFPMDRPRSSPGSALELLRGRDDRTAAARHRRALSLDVWQLPERSSFTVSAVATSSVSFQE